MMTKRTIFDIFFVCWILQTSVAMVQKEILNNFNHIRTQENAAIGVISRLIPTHAHLFQVQINTSLPLNTFRLHKSYDEDYLLIEASNGVSACKGFYFYIKYMLGLYVSWTGNQLKSLPDKLPPIQIEISSPSRFIYYQNVCTWSYSFSWWTWSDWRKHIDWMALMGISLSLAPIQDEIWTKVYKDFGLTDEEIADHLSGPGFEAWQRMGNIRGWGGPPMSTFKTQQLALQKQIINAQRNLGMTVAVPAFAGHVPVAFKRLYPNSTLTSVDCWNRFPEQYCCPIFVDPTDPLFQEVGTKFVKEVIREYGTDHIYFSDPFNEIQPRYADANYLGKVSESIFSAMTSADPKAIWLLQGWMFVKNPFWSQTLLKAFLTAVPLGRMLVLDLQSEQFPQYERTNSYYGQPFIWCMLHNFGGTLGMHGSIHLVNSRIDQAKRMENSTMVGVGITPEGINQNYVVYEFALERGWSARVFDEDIWFSYFASVKYGTVNDDMIDAWALLLRSVYSFHGLEKINGKYTIARRPSSKLSVWTWYNHALVTTALGKMLNASDFLRHDTLYNYDLVDLTRQFLQNKGDELYINIIAAFKARDILKFRNLSEKFCDLLIDLERILNTNEHFLLGNWLKSAKAKADSPLEEEIFESNARNQITAWGPNGQIIDYATKQWAGIVIDFFLPRWQLFFTALEKSLLHNVTYNENKFRRTVLKEIEIPFTTNRKLYSEKPEGDSINIAAEIYHKWTHLNITGLMKVPLKVPNEEIEFTDEGDNELTTGAF